MNKLLSPFTTLVVFLLFNVNASAVTTVSSSGRFNATYTGCTPVNVTFTSLSVPSGTSYKTIYYGDASPTITWGAGAIAHAYTIAGTYDIFVNYFNSFGSAIGYDYVRVEIFGQPSAVVNSYGATTACPGDKIRMNVSQGWESISTFTYAWNWGDGSPIETTDYHDMTHTYAAPGTYTITVTTSGGMCAPATYTSTGTFTITNTGVPLPPYIGYNVYANPAEICPGEETYFGYPDEFASTFILWGDGTNSTTNEHRHSYAALGTYYPTVTITNGCGSSITVNDTVRVVNTLPWSPTAYYDTYNTSPICPGEEISMNTWINATAYHWYNEDGILLSTANYFRTDDFTTIGTDSVYVVITNGCGFDTSIYSPVLVVNNLPVDPDLIAPLLPSSICTGSQFAYIGSGQDTPDENTTYEWDFGDGTTSNTFAGIHQYATNGTYNVTLTATNSCGSDSTITIPITAGPGIAPDPALFNYFAPEDGEGCVGDSILFVGVYYLPDATYNIDFGDGATSATPQTIHLSGVDYFYYTHAYSTLGTFNTSLTITNSCGLSITKTMDVVIGSSFPADMGVFYDEYTRICLGEPVIFHSYGANQFIWNFGDGTGTLVTTNVMDDVPHIYQNPGSYTLSVQGTNACGNTSTRELNILIPDNRINITTNTIDAQCHAADGKAIAVITGGNPPYEVTWSNGSNDILVDSLASGIYVCNVSDQNGCYNFGIATVSDAQAPAIVINTVVDVTCNGGNDGAIDINVIGSSGPYHFMWSNGSTSEDLSGLVSGPYEVYVTDANGCISTASIYVDQPDKVQVSFIVTDANCGSNDGKIVTSANGNSGPFTYVWNNGSVGPVLTGVGLGVYEVNVIDARGCVVTAQTTVDENNGTGGPAIALNSISALNCSGTGSTIDISVFNASGTPTYSWSDGVTTTQDITVTSEGNYTVTVTDALGCQAIEVFTVNHADPAGINVCMVTVDSMYSANKVIWEKPVSTTIKEFKIYRESSMAGLYYHVGTVPYDSLSIYTDAIANPQIQSWRYKISAVDFCGAESGLSSHHKTIHLNQNLGLTPGSVNLIWDDYEGFGYTSFNVVKYTQAGGYQTLATISALNHSYTDLSAPLTDSSLFYVITVDLTDPCVATRAQNNNTIRSNRSDNAITLPIGLTETANGIGYSHVYPNPTNQNLTVEFEVAAPGNYTLSVVNTMGQTVMTSPCGNVELFYKKEMDVSGLERGTYIVTIQSGAGKISKRFVKL